MSNDSWPNKNWFLPGFHVNPGHQVWSRYPSFQSSLFWKHIETYAFYILKPEYLSFSYNKHTSILSYHLKNIYTVIQYGKHYKWGILHAGIIKTEYPNQCFIINTNQISKEIDWIEFYAVLAIFQPWIMFFAWNTTIN